VRTLSLSNKNACFSILERIPALKKVIFPSSITTQIASEQFDFSSPTSSVYQGMFHRTLHLIAVLWMSTAA